MNFPDIKTPEGRTNERRSTGDLSLQVQLLAYRLTHLEGQIGRTHKIVWLLVLAHLARFGIDIKGLPE